MRNKKAKQKKFRDGFIGLFLLAIILLTGTFAWSGVRNMAFNPLYDHNFGGRFHDHFAPVGDAGRGAGTHDQQLFAENFGTQYIFVRARLREFASEDGEPLDLNRPAQAAQMVINDPMTWPIFLASNENVNTRRVGSESALIGADDRVNLTLGDTRATRHTFMPTFNHADRMATSIATTFPISIPTFRLLNAFEMSEAVGHAIDAVAGGNTFANTSINHEDIEDVPAFIEIGQQTGPGLLGFTGVPDSVTVQGGYRHFVPGTTMTSPRLFVDTNNQLTLQNNGQMFTHVARETLAPGHGSIMTIYQWRNNDRPSAAHNEDDVLINNFWVMDSESNDGWFYFAAPIPPGEGTSLLMNSLELNNVNNRSIEYILHVDAEFTTREGLDNGAWGDLPPELEEIWDLDDANSESIPEIEGSFSIYPAETELITGATQQFTIETEALMAAFSDDEGTPIEWTVEGNNHSGTTITQDGLLTISTGETSEALIVQAHNLDTDESGVAFVVVSHIEWEYRLRGIAVPGYHRIGTTVGMRRWEGQNNNPSRSVNVERRPVGTTVWQNLTLSAQTQPFPTTTPTWSVVNSSGEVVEGVIEITNNIHNLPTGWENNPWQPRLTVPTTATHGEVVFIRATWETPTGEIITTQQGTTAQNGGIYDRMITIYDRNIGRPGEEETVEPTTPDLDLDVIEGSFSIYPAETELITGATQQFTIETEALMATFSDEEATTIEWTVEGNNHSGTTITQDGLLTISTGETSEALIVQAHNPDTDESGVAFVVVSHIEWEYRLRGIATPGYQAIGATHSTRHWAGQNNNPNRSVNVERRPVGTTVWQNLTLGAQTHPFPTTTPTWSFVNGSGEIIEDVEFLINTGNLPTGWESNPWQPRLRVLPTATHGEVGFLRASWETPSGEIITTQQGSVAQNGGIYDRMITIYDRNIGRPGEEETVEPTTPELDLDVIADLPAHDTFEDPETGTVWRVLVPANDSRGGYGNALIITEYVHLPGTRYHSDYGFTLFQSSEAQQTIRSWWNNESSEGDVIGTSLRSVSLDYEFQTDEGESIPRTSEDDGVGIESNRGNGSDNDFWNYTDPTSTSREGLTRPLALGYGSPEPFVLSIAELNSYFPEGINRATGRIGAPAANTTWWLRSSAILVQHSAINRHAAVNPEGSNNFVFVAIDSGGNRGFRPALWINVFEPELTLPPAAVGCAQTGTPANLFTDTTGFQWCAVREQTIGGDTYVMLVSRYTLQMENVGGATSNQVHNESTHVRWPATTEAELPPLTGNHQGLGPAGRARVHTWWNGQHAGTANHVSPALRSQAVHARIPRNDDPSQWNHHINRENDLSIPIPGSMGANTPVFFLSEAEANILLGSTPLARIGNRINDTLGNSGTGTLYWLRSSGNTANHTANVNSTGNWSVSSAGFTDAFHAFRPAIWVRRPDGDTANTPTPVGYSITFNANGGSVTPETITNIESGSDVSFSDVIPEKAGHTFIGWTFLPTTTGVNEGNADFNGLVAGHPNNFPLRTPSIVFDVTENMTLSALWRTNQTISFDGNGHTGGTVPAQIQTRYSAIVNRPTAEPTRTGYEFVGWFNGQTQFGNTHTVGASDVTFTARWERMTFNITFDANGGTGAPGPIVREWSNVGFTGVPSTTPHPVRPGYVFIGWSRNQEDSLVNTNVMPEFNRLANNQPNDGTRQSTSTVVREDMALRAVWRREHRVEFTPENHMDEMPGGGGVPDTITTRSGALVTIPEWAPELQPTRYMHFFAGWRRQIGPTDRDYYDGRTWVSQDWGTTFTASKNLNLTVVYGWWTPFEFVGFEY